MGTKGARSEREPAERLPVARVCVDVALPHLDRPFDYLVAAADDEAAQPGVRVKVRFAGQLMSGFLLERVESSGHGGKLSYLEKVVSAERVLDPEIARLARAVADRYAGNLADVLRLAVPPRHARVETAQNKTVTAEAAPTETDIAEPEAAEPETAEPETTEPETAEVPRGAAEELAGAEALAVAGRGAAVAAAELRVDPVAAAGLAELRADPAAGAGLAELRADPAAEAGLAELRADPAAEAGLAELRADPAAGAGLAELRADPVARAGAAGIREPAPGGWDSYATGPGYLRALEDGRAARAVWSGLPGEDWPTRIAEAAAATVRGGRGVVIVVADARDLDRVDRALGAVLGEGRHVALNAALGPAERYRRFLAASRHRVPVVAGTRAAVWAPVEKLGLVVIWDDGDDVLAEPRAPYPHAREVLLTRAQLAGCGVLVGGFARTGEAQLLLETGWAKEIVAERAVLRRRSPAIAPTGDDPQLARDPGAVSARLPSLAWQTARQALQNDAPVLVQVPRRGYLPSVACAECRTPARCPHCAGPLGLQGARDVPICHWCGRGSAAYSCPACGERRLRASVTGARRTAEELGRAFPGVPVRTSGKDEVLVTVPAVASVVVSTPGAEPAAEGGGYGAVLLLDAWALLSRSDLRAAEETMRRWLNAAALARPADKGGKVVVVADGSLAPVQALLRWDPGWFAARELAERRELGFPPAARMASITGTAAAVADLLAHANLPDGAEVLGPVPAPPARGGPPVNGGEAPEEQERMLLRVSRSKAGDLARALHEAAAMRSTRKASQPVRIQVDPADLF
ncbi:primosomal protein N' [Actinoplanes sp. CA-015351]|uniref:primosomal protein N' n=1 Tax=Actinoplanes sp. CA-015351 TaxID=3239897 RepID=UPI003D992A81